jgi:ribosomal protein L39E
MAKNKHLNKKLRLVKANRQTKWAPYWVVLKKFGLGKPIHPSRVTVVKRSWRRKKIKA